VMKLSLISEMLNREWKRVSERTQFDYMRR